MTTDHRADPNQPGEPWLDRPLTTEELRALRVRLSRILEREMVKF